MSLTTKTLTFAFAAIVIARVGYHEPGQPALWEQVPDSLARAGLFTVGVAAPDPKATHRPAGFGEQRRDAAPAERRTGRLVVGIQPAPGRGAAAMADPDLPGWVRGAMADPIQNGDKPNALTAIPRAARTLHDVADVLDGLNR